MLRFFIFLLSALFIFNNSFANFGDTDQRFMTGFSVTQKESKFYLGYQEKNPFEKFNKFSDSKVFKDDNPDIKIPFKQETFKTPEEYSAQYTGYKNVEGFKNNKRKNDVKFAVTVISVGVLAIVAGAFTVNAVVDAID